jgi:hypothetical protein
MYKYSIVALVAGLAGSILARRKGHNPLLWFILCMLFPLLIVVVLVLPPKERIGINKKCQFCGEIINADAKVCRHCGYTV